MPVEPNKPGLADFHRKSFSAGNQPSAPNFLVDDQGNGYFAGNVTVVGSISETGSGVESFTIKGTEPRLIFWETDGAADEKIWDLDLNSGTLAIRTRTDADGSGGVALSFTRSTTTVTGAAIASPLTLGSGTSATLTFGGSSSLTLDAANQLALRNGTNPQILNVYNTYTDSSNYEVGQLGWSSNIFIINANKAGTGSFRGIGFGVSNALVWNIGTNGNLTPAVDNAVTIGDSTHRASSIYASNSVLIGTNPAGTGAVNLANTAAISFRNAANGDDVIAVKVDGTNNIILGETGHTNPASIIPGTDNLIPLGSASKRFSAFFTGGLTATGTTTLATSLTGTVRAASGVISADITTFTAYAAGTAYSLTNSSAALTFGTTQPAITITTAATYALFARVRLDYNGATFAASRTVTLKLRRTNNTAADLTSGSTVFLTDIVTTKTATMATVELPPVIYTTANTNDAITIFADVSVVPSAGSLDAVQAEVVAIRL